MSKIDNFVSKKIRVLSLMAIVAVVFIHTNTAEPRFQLPSTVITGPLTASNFVQFFISNGLARFCIPLFFTISGYLFFFSTEPLRASAFKRKFVSRLSTILLPLVIWSLIGFVLTRLVLNIPFFAASVAWPDVKLDLVTLLKFIPLIPLTPLSFQLWFLMNLFVLALLGYPLYLLLKTRWIYPVFAGAVVAWLIGLNLVITTSDGLLFFLLGGYIAVRRLDVAYRLSKGAACGLVIGWIVLVLAGTLLSYTYSLPVLHQVTVFVGLLAVWFGYDHFLSDRMRDRLSRLSDHTFFIYAGHAPFVGIAAESLVRNMGNSPNVGLAAFLVLPPLFIAVLVAISALVRRLAPRVHGILTGGRGTRSVQLRPEQIPVAHPAGS